MVDLHFGKKKPEYGEEEENFNTDKNPKMLLEKIRDFESGFRDDEKKEREEKKEEKVTENELKESPLIAELEEQYRKGEISSKSYEDVLKAFRSLKTSKRFTSTGMGEDNNKEPQQEGSEKQALEVKENSENKTENEEQKPAPAAQNSQESKDEAPKEDNGTESKEAQEKPEKKEEKPAAKKKDGIDENYDGMGPLNALRKFLLNTYKKNQKEKAYWTRAGTFFYPFDDVLGDLNSILSEQGLLSIDIDTLKKYMETLGFVDGTSIVDEPVKTPGMEKEESRTVVEYTPQALEKLNSEEELKEPDQQGKKHSDAPPADSGSNAPSSPVPAGSPAPAAVQAAPPAQIAQATNVEYEKAFEELRTKIEGLQERFSGLNDNASGLSDRLSELRGQMTTREKNLGEMQLKIETLSAQMGDVNPQGIAKFQGQVTAKLENFDADFKELRETVADLLKRFEKVSEVFKDLRNIKLLIDVGKDVGEKLVKIEEAETIINRLSNKVEDMYLQVEKKFSDLPVFVDKVNRIDGLSFELLQAMDTLKNRMADYVSKTELGEYKAKLDSKFSKVEDEIDLVSDKPLTDSDRDYFSKVLDFIGKKKEDLKNETHILNEQFDDALISQKAYNELRRIKDEKKQFLEDLEGRLIAVLDRGRTDRRDLEMLYKQCRDLTGDAIKKPLSVGAEPKKEEGKQAEIKPPETMLQPAISAQNPVLPAKEEQPEEDAKPALPAKEEPKQEEAKEQAKPEEKIITPDSKPEEVKVEKPAENQAEPADENPKQEESENNAKPEVQEEQQEPKKAAASVTADMEPKKIVKYITFPDSKPEKPSKDSEEKQASAKEYDGPMKDILANLQKLRQEYEPGNFSLSSFENARNKIRKN